MSYNTRRTRRGGRGISSIQVDYRHQKSWYSDPEGLQQPRKFGYSAVEFKPTGYGTYSIPHCENKPPVKVFNKVREQHLDAELHPILKSKNPFSILNDLRGGDVKFVIRKYPRRGFVASVDIDGKLFSGRSMTVTRAKMQASEQALKHLLLEKFAEAVTTIAVLPEKKERGANKDQPMEECEDETESKDGLPRAKRVKTQQEDELTWVSLSAFALDKLFAEWQNEEIENGLVLSQNNYDEDYFGRSHGSSEFDFPRRFPMGPFGRGIPFDPYPPRMPPPTGFGITRRPPLAANILWKAKPTLVPSFSIFRMKKIPEDATKRHPVMLLNQLWSNIVYNESLECEPPYGVSFVIKIILHGKVYVGKGKSKKQAKVNAAKAALLSFGIKYDEEIYNFS